MSECHPLISSIFPESCAENLGIGYYVMAYAMVVFYKRVSPRSPAISRYTNVKY